MFDISLSHGGSPSDLVASIEDYRTTQMLLRIFLPLTSTNTSLLKTMRGCGGGDLVTL